MQSSASSTVFVPNKCQALHRKFVDLLTRTVPTTNQSEWEAWWHLVLTQFLDSEKYSEQQSEIANERYQDIEVLRMEKTHFLRELRDRDQRIQHLEGMQQQMVAAQTAKIPPPPPAKLAAPKGPTAAKGVKAPRRASAVTALRRRGSSGASGSSKTKIKTERGDAPQASLPLASSVMGAPTLTSYVAAAAQQVIGVAVVMVT
jgi:hypothetical protein